MTQLSIHISAEPRAYTGRELHSHFAWDSYGVAGDAAVAFMGPCDVKGDDLVDLEDARDGLFIHSRCMLHVIVEHFGISLARTVLLQRLLGRLAADGLLAAGVENLRVDGDDLYVAERKASVSIATCSPVSTLIHWGINVDAADAPVPAWGLNEHNLDAESFARQLLGSYQAELADIHRATTKVRGVP